MSDQAEKLRERIANQQLDTGSTSDRTRIITICSGKGGVGKSNLSANLAIHLAKQKKKVLLFDLDFGLANIDVLLGIPPKHTLMQMVDKQYSIWDVVEEGPEGMMFVAGGSGFQHLFQLEDRKINLLFQELNQLQGQVDYLILDTGAGLSNELLRFILAAHDVIIVTTPEPTAITDAYAVIKMIYLKDNNPNIKLVINRSTSVKEGKSTAQKLQMVAKKFLNIDIEDLGYLPEDPAVVKAVKQQSPFYIQYPNSEASEAIVKIAQRLLNEKPQEKFGLKAYLKRIFS